MPGTAPMASATIVEVGLTAYGCDSEPTHTAPIRAGSIWARASALRAASIDIVDDVFIQSRNAFLRHRSAAEAPSVHTREISLPGRR